MNLTRYTDYSLRVLVFLAIRNNEKASINDIADFYGISKDHLVKVVHHLGKMGYIRTARGRGGGITLAREPGEINVGEVVRATETNFVIVECFDPCANQCKITPFCNLKHILRDALDRFFEELDRYTLHDLVSDKRAAAEALAID